MGKKCTKMLTVIFSYMILCILIFPNEKDFPVQTDNMKNLLRANIIFQGRKQWEVLLSNYLYCCCSSSLGSAWFWIPLWKTVLACCHSPWPSRWPAQAMYRGADRIPTPWLWRNSKNWWRSLLYSACRNPKQTDLRTKELLVSVWPRVQAAFSTHLHWSFRMWTVQGKAWVVLWWQASKISSSLSLMFYVP